MITMFSFWLINYFFIQKIDKKISYCILDPCLIIQYLAYLCIYVHDFMLLGHSRLSRVSFKKLFIL